MLSNGMLQPALTALLDACYREVWDGLGAVASDTKRKEIGTAISSALVCLAQAGQTNPDKLVTYARFKARETLHRC